MHSYKKIILIGLKINYKIFKPTLFDKKYFCADKKLYKLSSVLQTWEHYESLVLP
jgi:hypothetical protein